MQHKIVLCAGLIAAGLAASPASAQPVLPLYPGAVRPAYMGVLPPSEIVAVVRSIDLIPLSQPFRHGPIYGLRAGDAAGREVRVIVDARSGRILRVFPAPPRFAGAVLSPQYGWPSGRMVPDGYGPNSRIAALPPGVEGMPAHGPALNGAPGAYAPAAAAPLPRPRPKIAAVDAVADKSAIAVAPPAGPTAAVPPRTSPVPGAVAAPVNPIPPALEFHE